MDRQDGNKGQKGAVGFSLRNMEKKKRNTILLAGALLIILSGGLLIQRLIVPDSGKYVVVTVNGYRTATLDLDRDTEKVIGDRENGDYNIVKVKDGKAWVSEANCGNQVCVLTGEISKRGDIIACLPHGMLVYIEDRDEETKD